MKAFLWNIEKVYDDDHDPEFEDYPNDLIPVFWKEVGFNLPPLDEIIIPVPNPYQEQIDWLNESMRSVKREEIKTITYYYTESCPENEVVDVHNTIYVNTEGLSGNIKRFTSGVKAFLERINKK